MSADSLREQLQSTLGNAYTLDRELGGGGMSRVFVADEARLKRKVVVKVLSPELAAGVSAERFEREIQLAASLQQANIVPLLNAGETEGLPFYTMPFVEGLSLRARLATDGALALNDVVSTLRDVSRALAYAHERGVVHRDIKPENILLSGGAAVVTDFGIAKALAASRTQAPGGTLTQVGTSLGTPAYMAPEQATGDPDTDHRADIYALGCVAYEMLTGAAPFAGRPTHQLIAAHMNEMPANIAGKRPEAPKSLTTLVMRCLEKDPARRPQSAMEILQSLDAVTSSGTGATARGRRSWMLGVAALIVVAAGGALLLRARSHAADTSADLSSVAVLPFENASGDTASNYFADGMTDELATALAKVPGLRVASRTSSYTFRKRDGVDARTIASKLQVGAIVEGSVRRAGNQLRVTAQLTRGADGQSLWADAFTADAGDVFAVQARLTQAIVAAVTPTLAGKKVTDAVVASVADAGTKDMAAYDTYLRARYELNRRGDGVRKSIALFRQAIARDSTFVAAWSGLSAAWGVVRDYDLTVTSEQALDSARDAATHARALDSLQWESYAGLGYALTSVGHYDEAEPLLRRATELGPRETVAHRWYGILLGRLDRQDQAVREMRTAVAIDPLSAVSASNLAIALAKDPATYAEARAFARRSLALDPSNFVNVNNSALAMIMTGEVAEATAMVRNVPTDAMQAISVGAMRVEIFAAEGQHDSLVALSHAVDGKSDVTRGWEAAASAHAALGQWDRAFELAETITKNTPTLDWMFQVGPIWRPAAHDPRMRALCTRTHWNCDRLIWMLDRTVPLRKYP